MKGRTLYFILTSTIGGYYRTPDGKIIRGHLEWKPGRKRPVFKATIMKLRDNYFADEGVSTFEIPLTREEVEKYENLSDYEVEQLRAKESQLAGIGVEEPAPPRVEE